MNTPLIHAESLDAGYGSVAAITDIDLHVQPGELVALIGANGAGKTTTLLTLAGALKPSRGHVTLFGARARPSVRHRVHSGLALLPEQRAVIMGLTVRENLLLGRGGVDRALAHFPELERRLDTRAGLTSGGEQQMLALGRILAGDPKLILADELSLGLAPLIVRRLLEALSTAARRGVGVLLVEQHPRTALAWAHRAYVMRRGRIELTLNGGELTERMDDVMSLYL
jgi:ABC-type branched-subunit amino acid transport system ATPase component